MSGRGFRKSSNPRESRDRDGRGGSRGRGGSGWGGGHRKEDNWSAPPVVEEAPKLDPDTTPITTVDGSFTYPQMTAKAGAALRALRDPSSGVDDRTRPILEKWEEKVLMALKMSTPVPEPPSWQVAASRTGGWGSSGDTGNSRVTENFMALAAASAKKKPGKNKKADAGESSGPTPNDTRLKARIVEQNNILAQQQAEILRVQNNLQMTVEQMNEKVGRRDQAILRMSQYLSQLTGKTLPGGDAFAAAMGGGYSGPGWQQQQQAPQLRLHQQPLQQPSLESGLQSLATGMVKKKA